MRLRDIAALNITAISGLIGLFIFGGTSVLSAQPADRAAVTQTADAQIMADSPPYRIEWNGTSGVFIRKAFGQDPEQRMPLG